MGLVWPYVGVQEDHVPEHCTAALSPLGCSGDTLQKEHSGQTMQECVFPKFVSLLSLQ